MAGAGASIVFGLIVWWAYGRFESRAKKSLSGVGALLVALIVYFLLGFVFVMVRPERAHETGTAMVRGLKAFTLMLIVVNSIVLAFRLRPKSGTA